MIQYSFIICLMPHFLSVMINFCLIFIIGEILHMEKAAIMFISSHYALVILSLVFSQASRTEMHHLSS